MYLEFPHIPRKAFYVAIFAVLTYAVRIYMRGASCHSQARIDGKTIIVTGANTGIGKETALDLARRGGRVILACRSLQRGEEAAADIQHQLHMKESDSDVLVMKLDLSSLTSVRQFVDEFKRTENRLDILINNAGVAGLAQSKTEDGFETTFAVNHLGHFLLTNLLLDLLKQSAPSRIVTVSSRLTQGIQIDDLMLEKNYNHVYAYGQSKLANILFSRHLAKILEGSGVTTYSLAPGLIRTEIGRNLAITKIPGVSHLIGLLSWPFLKTPTEGAQTMICCAVDESLLFDTGKFYWECMEGQPAGEAENDKIAQQLWDVSVNLVKL